MVRVVKRPRLTKLLTKGPSKSNRIKNYSPTNSESKSESVGCVKEAVQKLNSTLCTVEVGIIVECLLQLSIFLSCCPGKMDRTTGEIKSGDRQNHIKWWFCHLLFLVRSIFFIQYALQNSFWAEISKGRPTFDHVFILTFIPMFALQAVYTVNVVWKKRKGCEFFNEFLKLDRIFAEKLLKKPGEERSRWPFTSATIQEFPTIRKFILLIEVYSIIWLFGVGSYICWFELNFPKSMCVIRANLCPNENYCHPGVILFCTLIDLWAGLFFSLQVFYANITLGYSALGIVSMLKVLRDQPENDLKSLLSLFKKIELLEIVALDFVNPLFMPCVPFLFEVCIVFCNYGSIKSEHMLASGGIMAVLMLTSLSAIFTLIVFSMFRGGEVAFGMSSEFLSSIKRNCRFQLCSISPYSPSTSKEPHSNEEEKNIERKREERNILLKTVMANRPIRLQLGNFSRIQADASLPLIHSILDNTISFLLLF